MLNLFFKDVSQNTLITWDYLLCDIAGTKIYNKYCKSFDYYTVFKQIIISILLGEEIILLDSDFTDSELKYLTGHSEYHAFNREIEKDQAPTIKNKYELIEYLHKPPEDWRVTLFTSGTTGAPHKVIHNFASITRFVRMSESNKDNIWGFAYNPTHMAGLQVFFQALMNGNSLIRLFGLNNMDIFNEIKNNNITHISATPTFYRLLLPGSEVLPSVRRITSGGEIFNHNTFTQLKDIFPNAKITNVYASTEAGTLFASHNEIFSVPPSYEHLIDIRNRELHIHNSLMGSSFVNNEEWYNTGDEVDIVSHTPLAFRFVNRKSMIINTGGYKVNPYEVEEAILSISGIENAMVYPQKNSVLGNIVCCDVVAASNKVNESTIRSHLQSKIQEYKIPRIIRFVKEISITRTGKTKRNNS